MAITRYLRKVCLDADVYAFCIQHALTTEKQEVMGLLIGEVYLTSFILNYIPVFARCVLGGRRKWNFLYIRI